MKTRLERILQRIRKTAIQCGRNPERVRLVAVSKTVPIDRIKAAIEAGARILGENYVQEAREKVSTLASAPVSWHFIGYLQTNKAKYAVRLFDMIHTVDSVKLARELSKQARKINKTQAVLVQVNVSGEASKAGVAPREALELVRAVSQLEHLAVKGLMTIPPFFDDPAHARPYFVALRTLRDRIRAENIPGVHMDELSMGMTGDFEVAIEEGATLVRIGTAIFGRRS